MKALVIARINLLRTLRDRLGLFFIVILPMILIVVLGMTYGGMNSARIGVADADGGPLALDLVAGISAPDLRLDLRHYDTAADLRDAVEGGFVEIGLAIPAGYDATLRSGGQSTVEVVAQPKSIASVVRTAVDAAIAEQTALVEAARFTASTGGVSFDDALVAARAARPNVAGVGVTVEAAGDVAAAPSGFTVGAESQVILFMFLTSMTGAATLISTRQLGISRREFSTPTSARSIILGETLGRLGVAIFQGAFIVIATAVLFQVDWLDPLASGAIIVVFAVVSSGAAMLLATLVSNEAQLGAAAPALGMILGLLGGTMVPIEVFPDFVRTIAHVTPHAWAIDAFHELLLNGGGLGDVLPQVGVLLGFAVVLLGLAVLRFRRLIASGAL
jgi:ABC-2 type transport system permease protein